MADLLKSAKLLRKSDGAFVDADASALTGKVVALYFSAHWCPPCKAFTPILKDFYEELAGEAFEVVFVSFDRSDDDMQHYMNDMHGEWLTVKFGDPAIQSLSTKYSVQGIPTLVIIKPNGDAVVANGRADVQRKDKAPKAMLGDWKAACGL